MCRNIKGKYGKEYSASYTLKGVDISINKGENVAIIGESSSGESILMHILSLLCLLSAFGIGKLINGVASDLFLKELPSFDLIKFNLTPCLQVRV